MSITHKKLTFWSILTLLYMAAVAYLCFASPDNLPEVRQWSFFIPQDKVVHFCMFSPLPFLLYQDTATVKMRTGLKISLCLIAGIFIAGLTEIIQGFSPYRSMELGDFIADCLGMGVSCLLLATLKRKKIF